MTAAPPRNDPSGATRSSAMRAALLVGAPMGAGVLALVHSGWFRGTLVERYLSHPVEWAEIVLFCCALAALSVKLLHASAERRAQRADILPPWDGQPAPLAEASLLLADVQRLPSRLSGTWLVGRVRAVLDFLRSRRSAADLDDQLRTLADNDITAIENSYSLIRFICWAIPILGFLGTVLGITDAVAGVTPEILEQSLNQVTDGLALAFDTTALALALTMILMFLSFVTERLENGVLEQVDAFVDRELAHRFERFAGESGMVAEAMRRDMQTLVQATEQLVRRQVEIWANALAETEQRRLQVEKQAHERLTAGLEHALEYTLRGHAEHLAAQEEQTVARTAALLQQLTGVAEAVRQTGREQQQALMQVAEGIAAQADVLGRLQDGEKQLLQMQELLQQNLSALAGVGTFEQAVHSLTAAVHMLSAAAVQSPSRLAGRRVVPDDAGKAA